MAFESCSWLVIMLQYNVVKWFSQERSKSRFSNFKIGPLLASHNTGNQELIKVFFFVNSANIKSSKQTDFNAYSVYYSLT